MASSIHSKYRVGWYLDQLQQSQSSLSTELSVFVKTLDITSTEPGKTPASVAALLDAKIKKAVRDYLRNGAGERFWPSHPLDPLSEKLEWSVEDDQKKIIGLVIGLTYLKVLYRKRNQTDAVRETSGTRHIAIANSLKNEEISENQVDQLAPMDGSAVHGVSSHSKRRGDDMSTLGTVGEPAIQVRTSNKRLCETPQYAQGEAYHRKRARKLLENAKLASVFCTRCTAAKIDCYVADGRDICAFCASRGVRISDCKPSRAREDDSVQDGSGAIAINTSYVSSPSPSLLDRATEALKNLKGPQRPQNYDGAQLSDNTAQQAGVAESSSTPNTSPTTQKSSTSRRASTLPEGPGEYIDLTQADDDALEEALSTHPHQDVKPEPLDSTTVGAQLENAVKRSSSSDIPVKQESSSSTSLQTTSTAQSSQQANPPEIVFRFFFANHSRLSPVEKPASSHSTMDSFFDEAYKVWSTMNSTTARDHPMIGVEVSWDETGTASTIQWREQSGFDLLMARVKRARPNMHGEVIVGVKCISQMSEGEAE
ncbi:hypothetical protein MMC18_006350 [Xylographa bjoerkii]|nr:hypothetical protein [Xylographa bjoerkii]